MKLVTFQSMEALKTLVNTGVLETDEKKIDLEKYGFSYQWITKQMERRVLEKGNVQFPLWCWVKFKKGICPPKHRGSAVSGFDVKITFHKPEDEVFITDYRRYSFILNNIYIPKSIADQENFQKELDSHGVTSEDLRVVARPDKYGTCRNDTAFLAACQKIGDSFERCITKDSDTLQGCVWRIYLSEVESIELLHDSNYSYGTFNYKRKDGTRFDWVEDFYKLLK